MGQGRDQCEPLDVVIPLANEGGMAMDKLLLIGVAGLLNCFVTPGSAAPITEMERKFCERDYHAYCGKYGLDSPALRTCMNKHGHSLSHGCIEALIDAGEVSRAEVERRERTGQ